MLLHAATSLQTLVGTLVLFAVTIWAAYALFTDLT